jgi:hypothetical protein
MRGGGNSPYDYSPQHLAGRARAIARTAPPQISSLLVGSLLAAVVLASLLTLILTFGPPKAFALSETGAGKPAPVSASHPAAVDCANGYILDFAGLPAGTILAEQYASLGVHISGDTNRVDLPDTVVVFDSDASGSNDPDLEVGVGNIAILGKNANDSNADGLVDAPDENNFGGKQIYTFDNPVHIGAFLFIDKDHGTPDRATAYDVDDNIIASALIPVGANASVQTIDVNADNVAKLEIRYRDSGGLTGIEVCPPAEAEPATHSSPTTPTTVTPLVATPRTVSQQSLNLPAVLPAALPRTGGKPETKSTISYQELAWGALAICGVYVVACTLRTARRRR